MESEYVYPVDQLEMLSSHVAESLEESSKDDESRSRSSNTPTRNMSIANSLASDSTIAPTTPIHKSVFTEQEAIAQETNVSRVILPEAVSESKVLQFCQEEEISFSDDAVEINQLEFDNAEDEQPDSSLSKADIDDIFYDSSLSESEKEEPVSLAEVYLSFSSSGKRTRTSEPVYSSNSESDYNPPKRKKITLASVELPETEGEWIEMRDENTNEFVFFNSSLGLLNYPYRNDGKGCTVDRYGNRSELPNSDKPKKNKFSTIKKHLDRSLRYEKDDVSDEENLVHHLTPSKFTVDLIKRLGLEKNPIILLFEDQELEDSNGNPLFIEFRGIREGINKKGSAILKGDFWFRKQSHNQPVRLLRHILRLAKYPEEIWSPSSNKGKNLRAFRSLTTRLAGKLYTLREIFPKHQKYYLEEDENSSE